MEIISQNNSKNSVTDHRVTDLAVLSEPLILESFKDNSLKSRLP